MSTEPGTLAPLPLTLSNWIDRLPEPVRADVLSHSTARRVGAGEFIWSRGDRGGESFQLIEGRARVFTLSPEGRELLYLEFTAGDCFGEHSLLDGLPRHHMLRAHTDVRLRVIGLRDFETLLSSHPEVARELLAMLSRRIRVLFDYYDSVALQPVPRRIAARMVLLAEFQATAASARDTCLDLNVTQEELGYMVAATRQSVNRVLAEWQRAGILELRYGNVTVMDLQRLRELAAD